MALAMTELHDLALEYVRLSKPLFERSARAAFAHFPDAEGLLEYMDWDDAISGLAAFVESALTVDDLRASIAWMTSPAHEKLMQIQDLANATTGRDVRRAIRNASLKLVEARKAAAH